CHAAEHELFRDPKLALTPAQHAASGFALELPHAKQECAQCHAPAGSFAERYPGRSAELCSQCHADPHGGQFEGGPFATGDCLACHEKTRWEPHTFDVAKHAFTGFALTGAHTSTDC